MTAEPAEGNVANEQAGVDVPATVEMLSRGRVIATDYRHSPNTPKRIGPPATTVYDPRIWVQFGGTGTETDRTPDFVSIVADPMKRPPARC